jgi:hypothetical protein
MIVDLVNHLIRQFDGRSTARMTLIAFVHPFACPTGLALGTRIIDMKVHRLQLEQ